MLIMTIQKENYWMSTAIQLISHNTKRPREGDGLYTPFTRGK